MKNMLLALTVLASLAATGVLAAANPEQPEYRAKLKDQVLYIMLSQPGTYVLPHLYIFDASGTAIYHKVGYDRKLWLAIDDAIKSGHSQSVPEPFPLSTFLDWVDFVAGSDDLQKLQSEQGVMTFVEFWAPCCEACRLERHAVASYLRDHPELKVRWLNVDADPETMDKTLRMQDEQERQENIRKQKGGA
jgi:thiol-disulfide isomerase/thioredoxin